MAQPLEQTARRVAAQKHGVFAEDYVASQLEKLGWRVIARNWTGGNAEIDLVVVQGAALRFVEVKARTVLPDELGDLISATKRRRLSRGAEAFLAQFPTKSRDIAFMVAFVSGGVGQFALQLIDDAFDGTRK